MEIRSTGGLPDLALLAVAAIWGTTFSLVGAAVQTTSPTVFLALRFGAAGLLMLCLLRGSAWPPGVWLHGGILALAGFAGFWFQTAGLRWTTPSRSAFVTGLSVVLVPAVVLLLFRRRPRLLSVAGAVLAAAGLVLLTSPGAGGWNRGDLLTLGCALCFAFYIAWLEPATRAVGGAGLRPLVAVQILGTGCLALVFLPLSHWTEGGPRLDAGAELWTALAVTVPLATVLTCFLQAWAQARMPPTRAAVILTMEPAFAALFAWIWVGERLGWLAWLGGGGIVAGMLVVELRPRGRHASVEGRGAGGSSGA